MADIILSDGREITFDLDALSIAEYRALLDPKQPREEENEILARVSGLTVEEYTALPMLQWRRLCKAFFEKAAAPLASPNSASESTTT